ncbi:nciI [Ornatilinea apprima]|uniref:NciI n=1 Tax=Ornatilinea apprima TaxID=1134406 RepID=A0A0P6XD35_9CHLR|nr:MvaI/BcnI family restriction endonuclease [Ornatilinea apprima]KPL77667.1 nciI [Ornatilinea apprima]
MKTYTKESLIAALKEIKNRRWIPNARPGNSGGIGNTLEDLLGIQENNLPIPNAAEWELKCQRANTSALTTLFHMEPSPRALKFVPNILLPNYGWKHELAGTKYPVNEMSFRQTIHGLDRSDRGFMVEIDKTSRKVLISFDASKVDPRHTEWLAWVDSRAGLDELTPQPYWGFDDLYHKAGTKLLNTFYVQAEVMKNGDEEFFYYNRILILRGFSVENFVKAIVEGNVLVDFDARTGHNHGTKFRLRQNALPMLYSEIQEVV